MVSSTSHKDYVLPNPQMEPTRTAVGVIMSAAARGSFATLGGHDEPYLRSARAQGRRIVPLLVGAILALTARLMARSGGFDRDRACHPTAAILFAWLYADLLAGYAADARRIQ